MAQYRIIAFYQFVTLADYADLQEPLRALCEQQQIHGTILLAAEGLNGTVAGPSAGIQALLDLLTADPRLATLTWKESAADFRPFERLRVRLKKEIVPLGVAGIDPTRQVGTYVKPEDWNSLISDPDVLVLDTRNHFEVAIGTFKGALDPYTESFREFASFASQALNPAQHPKIAMFCTGGIRCEKASAFLLSHGFQEVYQLEGGILNYLEQVPQEQSLWQGECFVFDNRVAVDHQLQPGHYVLNRACGHPRPADQAAYEAGCPLCLPQDRPQRDVQS